MERWGSRERCYSPRGFRFSGESVGALRCIILTRLGIIVIKTNRVFQDVFRNIKIRLNRHFHGGLERAPHHASS